MSLNAEKNAKKSISTPLMVNGKNLIKLQTIRSQSRMNISRIDKGGKLEISCKNMSFIKEVLKKSSDLSDWSSGLEKRRSKVSLDYTSSPKLPLTFTLPQVIISSNSFQKSLKKRKLKKLRMKNLQQHQDMCKSTLQLLQLSNGIEIIKPKKVYKYFIGSGNNDPLVNKTMNTKKGWVKVYNYQSANFVWTQLRKNEVMDLIPMVTDEAEKSVRIGIVQSGLFVDQAFAELNPLTQMEANKIKVYNRLERNRELSSKKRLFKNLKKYYDAKNDDVFNYLPLTFHITKGSKDPNFEEFKQKFKEIEQKISTQKDKYLTNIWLVKPGELTNRGNGISVCSTLSEIISKIDDSDFSKQNRTYLIQKYIYRPLLYKNRKFDIRCFTLITCFNNNLQAFFYQDGYLRTSVAEFSLENTKNKFIHLTNDAIQKRSEDYGRYEEGNKLSYQEFQEYLDKFVEPKVNFFEKILPKIKDLVRDSIKSTFRMLNPKERLFTFEILGYDFMIDEFYKPWLIEVNTNPCLSLSGFYLAELIPRMLKDAFQIALDQLFPLENVEPEENRFIMIFNKATYCGC